MSSSTPSRADPFPARSNPLLSEPNKRTVFDRMPAVGDDEVVLLHLPVSERSFDDDFFGNVFFIERIGALLIALLKQKGGGTVRRRRSDFQGDRIVHRAFEGRRSVPGS